MPEVPTPSTMPPLPKERESRYDVRVDTTRGRTDHYGNVRIRYEEQMVAFYHPETNSTWVYPLRNVERIQSVQRDPVQ